MERESCFRVSIIVAKLEIKLSWWFENISESRDLPTDCKRNGLCRASWFSVECYLLSPDRGQPVISEVDFSTSDRAREAQVCQLGAH